MAQHGDNTGLPTLESLKF